MTGLYIMLGILCALCIALIILVIKKKPAVTDESILALKQAVETSDKNNKETSAAQLTAVTQTVSTMQQNFNEQFSSMRQENMQVMSNMTKTTSDLGAQNAENIRVINDTLARELRTFDATVDRKLNEIKHTVDEQLQTNLDRKLQESFRTISEQLGAVQVGLGEMKAMASNMDDLRRTLSNVKTRGIWGEVQLEAILSEIMSPEQYDTNVVTVPKSTERVEFAIKLPGQDGQHVYLPIDSKFPGDTYAKLLDAYDECDKTAVEAAWKTLENTMCSEAKDIHDKYVAPPYTTEFAIMFLPVEGLYAEAVKRGMVEKLQSKYKINIAGPTTMAALLNSLQMGFQTLQIQKRSGEVWKILQATKVEFEKYQECLGKVQDRLRQTQSELETLVGVRTRQMNAKLAKIDKYAESEPALLTDGTS